MNRQSANDLIAQLHDAQNEFYGGGTKAAVLVGDGDRIATLTDGRATIRGVDRRWSTVGVYDVIDGQVGACWLLALDQRAFDAIWGG
jgi:hypothetical protein